jgi:hypothetical protein
MIRTLLKCLLPLAAVALIAGCPTEIGLQCPPNTQAIGQFTLNFTGNDAGNACVAVSVDGGDAGIGPLTLADAGQSAGTICFGAPDKDGNQLSLVISGKGSRPGSFLAGGGFAFASDAGPTAGTACVCPVSIVETFSGHFVSVANAADGGFALLPDGGIPPVVGLTGALTDTLTAGSAADPTCICKSPCTVSYNVVGTP